MGRLEHDMRLRERLQQVDTLLFDLNGTLPDNDMDVFLLRRKDTTPERTPTQGQFLGITPSDGGLIVADGFVGIRSRSVSHWCLKADMLRERDQTQVRAPPLLMLVSARMAGSSSLTLA